MRWASPVNLHRVLTFQRVSQDPKDVRISIGAS